MEGRLVDDPQVTLRLACLRAGRIEPYANDADTRSRAWRLSEVNVAKRRISGQDIPTEYADAARKERAEWGMYDRDKILILLKEQEGRLVGSAVAGDDGTQPVTVEYGVRGLSFSATAPTL